MFCSHSRVDTSTNALGASKFRAEFDRVAQRHSSNCLRGYDNTQGRGSSAESTELLRLDPGWLGDDHVLPPTQTGHDQTASILECAAITLAAGVITEKQVATIRRTNELLRQSSQSTEQGVANFLARQFHNGLLEACPNAHMVALLQSQSAAGSILQQTPVMTDAAIGRAADDHDEILRLIERGASSRTIERFLSEHMAGSTGCAATR